MVCLMNQQETAAGTLIAESRAIVQTKLVSAEYHHWFIQLTQL